MSAPEPALDDFLIDAGLIERGDASLWTPLTGGVSSDIWRVDAGSKSWCVKRALAQLKVAAEWKAPVERNAFEWDYMQVASAIAPGHVPNPIAHDPARGLFAMAWLAPVRHRLWKSELLAGRVDAGDAAAMGNLPLGAAPTDWAAFSPDSSFASASVSAPPPEPATRSSMADTLAATFGLGGDTQAPPNVRTAYGKLQAFGL